MRPSQPIYLVDASIYIFRAYFSLPENWHSPEGYPLNAVYGYTGFLLDLAQELALDGDVDCAAAFDESLGSCYRNQLLASYKSSRELPDEALAYQLQACRRVTEILQIPCYSGTRFEADDYIASLSRLARERQQPSCIVTRDKDLGQLLLTEHDVLWDYAAGARSGRGEFLEKFGVRPEQFADYLGLVGDASDDITGVPAIGAKTAARLLQAYPSLEVLSYNFDQLGDLGIRGAARIAATLEAHWPQALLSRNLAQLADGIPGLALPPGYRLRAQALEELLAYLQRIQISGGLVARCQRLLQRLRQD
jgi:5'-3' exonuclease